MLSLPPYRHEPLEQACFRLLILLPGCPPSPLCCSLVSANLLDFDDISGIGPLHIKSYEAVSYVWGDPDNITHVQCDKASLKIPVSLEAALLRFRDKTKPRVLWADSMCINQADPVEKAQQVSFMGLIYWKARRVLIWLGPDTELDTRKSAIRAAQTIREISELYEDSSRARTAMLRLEQHNSEILEKGDEDYQWEAVRCLLNQNWFTRVWVVQELGLARAATFHCGEACFDGDCLEDMLFVLNTMAPTLARFYGLNKTTLTLGYSYMSSTRSNERLELGADPTKAESFLDILEMGRGLECTDERDTVYAFLGHPAAFKKRHLDVAPYKWYPRNLYDQLPTLIDPDYDENTTTLDVYLRVAYVLIVEWKTGLDLLAYISHTDETIVDDYPSWVPRWNIPSSRPWIGSDRFYSAASARLPRSSVQLNIDNEDEHSGIQLKAVYLGTVYFAMGFPEASRFAAAPNRIPRHDDQSADFESDDPVGSAYSTLEELGQPYNDFILNDVFGFASTLTAGVTRHADSGIAPAYDNPSAHIQGFHAYRCAKAQSSPNSKHPLDCCHCRGSPTGRSNRDRADRFSRDLQNAAPYTTFFGTRDGRIGLGPSILSTRDEVWLLMGAKMPFILRPHGGDLFRIVGRSYLHGVMRGEAVVGLTESDFSIVKLF
jgi:hypothetical protein